MRLQFHCVEKDMRHSTPSESLFMTRANAYFLASASFSLAAAGSFFGHLPAIGGLHVAVAALMLSLAVQARHFEGGE